MENYKQCQLFPCFGDCGAHKRTRSYWMVAVTDLNGSVSDYLLKIGVTGGTDVTERKLIENRLGFHLDDNAQICPKHRMSYGTLWKAPSHCQHPHHDHGSKRKTSKRDLRPATLTQLTKLDNFPIGGLLCSKHRKTLVDKPNETSTEHTEVSEAMPQSSSGEEDDSDALDTVGVSASDSEFQPPPTRKDLDKLSASIIGEEAVSPIRYQISSPIETLSKSSHRYLKRKYREHKRSFKKRLAETWAPGQEAALMKLVGSSDSEDDTTENQIYVPPDLRTLVEAYQEAESDQAQVAILTLIPEKYQKQKTKMMQVFQCSKRKLCKAEMLKQKYGPAIIPPRSKCHRERLNMEKAEHFLDYLFTTGTLQDAAYGTRTLVLSTGDRQEVPQSILTVMRQHIIQDYLTACKESQCDTLSERTLFRILEAIKPSQRRAIGGLDNTAADGLYGFDMLNKILDDLCIQPDAKKQLLYSLDASKRYLKIGYKSHCESDDSQCATHCRKFALSSPGEEEFSSTCQHDKHNMICDQCLCLVQTLDDILELVTNEPESNRKDEIMYDVALATEYILEWFRHIIRGVQQEKAKTDVLPTLDDTSALWLKDWAQKVLPLRFREKQQDYFGKKGMSLAIDVFFMKGEAPGSLKKEVYFTVLERCDQNMASTLSVADHVLNKFSADYPYIKNLSIKSDNAGCYAGNSSAEVSYRICAEKGIKLLRYDYSEPQKGKDQADRESALVRRNIQAYVNSGHDVVCASDIKDAISYRGAVNGCVSIVSVNPSRSKVTASKIPNIKAYHSVKYQEDGMILWKYYNIGPGHFTPYQNVDFSSGIVVEEDFVKIAHDTVELHPGTDTRSYHNVFFCTDTECISTFKTNHELQDHVSANTHMYPTMATSYDKVKIAYSKRLSVSSHSLIPSASRGIPAPSTSNEPMHSQNLSTVSKEGWALKTKKVVKRLSPKQKQFVIDCFLMGENGGKKISADKAVSIMRSSYDKDGKKHFQPAEYLTRSQILSQFGTLAAKKRRGELILAGKGEILEDESKEEEVRIKLMPYS